MATTVRSGFLEACLLVQGPGSMDRNTSTAMWITTSITGMVITGLTRNMERTRQITDRSSMARRCMIPTGMRLLMVVAITKTT